MVEMKTFDAGKWTPYSDKNDATASVSVGWGAGEPGGSIMRSGDGYSGTVSTSWTDYVPSQNGMQIYNCSQSMQIKIVPWYGNLTGVNERQNPGTAGELPTRSALQQNFPNPFNPSTRIQYTVAGTRGSRLGASNTRLVVYDLLGREVAVLVNEKKPPGTYQVQFDGSHLSSGMYFYRMETGGFVAAKKLLLLK